ncbi:zinc ribbon domain-containing protein [Dolichospermum compactum]|uniref:zinc ribbon domain-containing protein n=1 Tax=Dolichospermum compactum TaxID=136073 RepID=UPI0012FDB1A9|nr:zinc ribbon domain-containing protein [Dolichospermum compactum]
MHLHEIHHSPLIACGEGVGGGVLVSHSIENRYKPVLSVNPKFTSQECSACHHISKANRDSEKFICENCGHIDRKILDFGF